MPSWEGLAGGARFPWAEPLALNTPTPLRGASGPPCLTWAARHLMARGVARAVASDELGSSPVCPLAG